MLAALVGYVRMGTPLVPVELDEAESIAKQLRGGEGDKEPERLMELAVRWVQANPTQFRPTNQISGDSLSPSAPCISAWLGSQMETIPTRISEASATQRSSNFG
jgi:hypothetical protein